MNVFAISLLLMQWSMYVVGTMLALLTIFTFRQAVLTYLSFKRYEKFNLPGPKPSILSGNMFHLTKDGALPHETIGRWLNQYGNIFLYFVAKMPMMVIKDASIIKQIMIRHFQTFPQRMEFSINLKPISESVLVMKGQRWKDHRSVLTPAFSSGKLKQMFNIISQKTDKFVRVLGEKSQREGEVEVWEYCSALTLDVIAHCALALNVDCLGNPRDEFFLAVKEYMRHASNPATRGAYIFPFLLPLVAFVNNHLTAGKMTTMIVQNLRAVIHSRRTNSSQRRVDLLQNLLDTDVESKDRAKMTDDEIIGNSEISLLAGYDTTGNGLSFTTYLLALHQDIQEKLYQEIKANIHNTNPTYDDLQGLEYLDQVICESLRYYPPVTMFITRLNKEDITVDGVFIPKDTNVMAPIYQLHHDPQYWEDPEKFDPERFSIENKSNIVQGSYLPFGIGPRNCVGMRLAQMEMKLAVAKLLAKYKLLLSSKTEVPLQLDCPTVIINPKNGVYLKLEER